MTTPQNAREERAANDTPSEECIDEAVMESFPASDVPSHSVPIERIGTPADPDDPAADEDEEPVADDATP